MVIGSTSNLTIGVYVGYDNPKSLGKYETGSKAALPIFKKFVETAVYREDIKNFKVPETINFFPINYDTGKITGFNNPKSVIEAFKEENFSDITLKNLSLRKKSDKFDIFTRFY